MIKEFASILSDGIGGPVTDKQQEFLAFVSDATRDLTHLVDDFLDSSKLRARTLRVDRRAWSIDELIDSAWPMLEARARSKRIRLERSVAPGLPRVFVDADKFRRTLVNLVVNAVKFSPQGEAVTVSAEPEARGRVRLGVTDRGPGIPEAQARELFQRFQQGSQGRQTSAKGFGLGLSIAKELSAINLGEVSVRSALGEGSVFSFTASADDRRSILSCFLDRTVERAPQGAVALLRVDRGPAPVQMDSLRALVASVCHATDLQIDGHNGRSIYVLGETLEVDRWRDRLIHEDYERQGEGEAPHPAPLQVELLGSWVAPDAYEPIASFVAGPEEKKRCA
ncbi:MAG: HAMP domain-containing sensor histidine kinase [Planctomycetota bacterium]